MRTRWIGLGAALALMLGGCAAGTTAQREQSKKRELSEATVVTCPECGKAFTIGAGLTEAERLE